MGERGAGGGQRRGAVSALALVAFFSAEQPPRPAQQTAIFRILVGFLILFEAFFTLGVREPGHAELCTLCVRKHPVPRAGHHLTEKMEVGGGGDMFLVGSRNGENQWICPAEHAKFAVGIK